MHMRPIQEKARKRSTRCECGNVKGETDPGCERCTYLDGKNVREQDIIEALRDHGNSTLTELCGFIGLDTSKENGRRSMLRTMQRLVQKQRVRVYEREGEPHEFNAAARATLAEYGMYFKHFASTVNVYALDGRTIEGR